MTSPGMDCETKKCTKNFPKAFNEKTNYDTQDILFSEEGMMGKDCF